MCILHLHHKKESVQQPSKAPGGEYRGGRLDRRVILNCKQAHTSPTQVQHKSNTSPTQAKKGPTLSCHACQADNRGILGEIMWVATFPSQTLHLPLSLAETRSTGQTDQGGWKGRYRRSDKAAKIGGSSPRKLAWKLSSSSGGTSSTTSTTSSSGGRPRGCTKYSVQTATAILVLPLLHSSTVCRITVGQGTRYCEKFV